MKKPFITVLALLLLAGAVYLTMNNVLALGALKKPQEKIPDAQEQGLDTEGEAPVTMPDINGEREPVFVQEIFLVGGDPTVEVAEWVTEHKGEFGVYRTAVEQADIYLISAGEKPTDGYMVRVDQIVQSGESWIVDFVVEAPGEGDMVAQVITYPTELVFVHEKGLDVTFRLVEGETFTEVQVVDTGSLN